MSRFFLNEIDPAHEAVQTPDPGVWAGVDGKDFLTLYSESIKIKGALGDIHLAHSVPSLFARPILFWQAFSNKRHPLHKEVVKQWRGLLGLIALQRVEQFSVVVRRYDVPSLEAAQGQSDANVATALRNQLPYPETDWDHWWLVYCNDKLVGATSAWTMFFTPSEYTCPVAVPWQQGGLLTDPISHYAPAGAVGPSYELTVVLRWVQLVLAGALWGLDAQGAHLQEHAGKVKHELETWRNELIAFTDASVVIDNLDTLPLVSSGAFRYFTQAPDFQPTARPASGLIIQTRAGVPDTIVLKRSGIEPTTRVWGSVFASLIDFSKDKLKGPNGTGFKARNGAEVVCPYVIAEEEFFPPKLLKIAMSSKALNRGTDQFAVPLTPAFFKYISYEAFLADKSMLRVSLGGESVVVRLNIPLRGGDDVLIVEKVYDLQKDVTEAPAVTPAFALWPEFQAQDWEEYFAAYSSTDSSLTVRPLLADGTLLNAAEPGQKMLRIWETKRAPIGFAVYDYGITGANRRSALRPVGLVLSAGPKRLPAPNPNKKWRVAVDFGTSSTHVLVDDGTGAFSQAIFAGRTLLLTQAESGLAGELTFGLYPNTATNAPFVTLLAENSAAILQTLETVPAWSPRFSFRRAQEEKYLPDVKWATGGTAGDLPLRNYLRNVVRLITSEARTSEVGALHFEWSYPLALPSGPRGAMADFWGSLAVAMSRVGGVSVTASGGTTESDAVCRCFAAARRAELAVRGSGLSIVVDVGGGSSDIGYWSSMRLLSQVSVKLAGNDLLPRLWELEGFLPVLYNVCVGARGAEDEWNQGYAAKFSYAPAVFINTLLADARQMNAARTNTPYIAQQDAGNPAQHPFVTHMFGNLPVGEAPWTNARSLIFLFYAGLSFYLGLHSRKLKTESNSVEVYFGGRGASLLAWVGNPKRVKEKLETFFRRGFERDNPANKNANVGLVGPAISANSSIPPKQEVVRGLLADIQWEGTAGPSEERTSIPCEAAWELKSGGVAQWDQELSAEELRGLKPPSNHESSFIAHLMNLIDTETIRELNLDPALRTIWSRKGAFSNRIEHYLGATSTLQPVFTCELAALMDLYVEEVVGGGPGASQAGEGEPKQSES